MVDCNKRERDEESQVTDGMAWELKASQHLQLREDNCSQLFQYILCGFLILKLSNWSNKWSQYSWTSILQERSNEHNFCKIYNEILALQTLG